MLTQEQKILRHLVRGLSLSGLEAADLYRVRDLPKRISVLRDRGVMIDGALLTDVEGGRYMRYSMSWESIRLRQAETRAAA